MVFEYSGYGKCPKFLITLFHIFLPRFLFLCSRMANSGDPDQEQSDLGPHCLHVAFCQKFWCMNSLQKHAYSNILKISPPKTENFQIKILIFFIFLLKT